MERMCNVLWCCLGTERKVDLSWCVGPAGDGSLHSVLHHGDSPAE